MFLVIRDKKFGGNVKKRVEVRGLKEREIEKLETQMVSDYSSAGEFEDYFTINLEDSIKD